MYLIDEDRFSQNPSYYEEELTLVIGDVKKWELLPVPIEAPLCRKVSVHFYSLYDNFLVHYAEITKLISYSRSSRSGVCCGR